MNNGSTKHLTLSSRLSSCKLKQHSANIPFTFECPSQEATCCGTADDVWQHLLSVTGWNPDNSNPITVLSLPTRIQFYKQFKPLEQFWEKVNKGSKRISIKSSGGDFLVDTPCSSVVDVVRRATAASGPHWLTSFHFHDLSVLVYEAVSRKVGNCCVSWNTGDTSWSMALQQHCSGNLISLILHGLVLVTFKPRFTFAGRIILIYFL